ncbi:MAG: sugar phosphate isomerase/epimerase family protein [Planctomycetaceae bacterium]
MNIGELRFTRRALFRKLGIGSASGAALLTGSRRSSAAATETPGKRDPTICAFTESFQDLPIPEVCRLFREIGLDGLDLTVRPGGHIAPEDAPRLLPEAVKAAHDHEVSIPMLTTGVTDADPLSERLVAAAGELGIRRIKLGYYRYGEFGTLRKQLDDIRRHLVRVAAMANKHGVLPCVHIHSGDTIPSHGTQLYELIHDMSPDEIGAYVDPMHMTIEGGSGGWRQGLDLLAPWIRITSIKNFQWRETDPDPPGQRRWRAVKVPIADGMAPLGEFLAALKALGRGEIFTLHSEYQGGGSFRSLSTEECIEQTKVDFAYLRSLLS